MSASAVTILVGPNVPNAFKQMELRGGAQDQPYAIKTPFEWPLFGRQVKTNTRSKALTASV